MQTRKMSLFAATWLLLSIQVAPLGAVAQDSDGPAITRRDLARSYLRVELALEGKELDAAETERVNKDFDRATLVFFQRKYGQALRMLDAVSASLMTDVDPDFVKRASAIRCSIDPPVYIKGGPVKHNIVVESLYTFEEETTLESTYALVNESGRIIHRSPFKFLLGPDTASTTSRVWDATLNRAKPDLTRLKPGRYTLAVAIKAGDSPRLRYPEDFIDSTTFTVLRESLDTRREAYAKRIDALLAETPERYQAIATVRARNNLLTDAPDPDNTAQMMIDPIPLADEIDDEIKALRKRKNPYRERTGDYWRVIETGDGRIPVRVFMPESAPRNEPVPLVVAFHGAGGDENMFMDAYGAGRIKELAEEHEFLLVSPLTYSFRGDLLGPYFELMVATLAREYHIDFKRIYVLGHSMGGGATSSVVAALPDMIAAAAPICGYRAIPEGLEDVPPLYVVSAEFDPLANPDRIAAEIKKTESAGYEVTHRFMENYGHTLGVGVVLPDVIEWLLAHTKD